MRATKCLRANGSDGATRRRRHQELHAQPNRSKRLVNSPKSRHCSAAWSQLGKLVGVQVASAHDLHPSPGVATTHGSSQPSMAIGMSQGRRSTGRPCSHTQAIKLANEVVCSDSQPRGDVRCFCIDLVRRPSICQGYMGLCYLDNNAHGRKREKIRTVDRLPLKRAAPFGATEALCNTPEVACACRRFPVSSITNGRLFVASAWRREAIDDKRRHQEAMCRGSQVCGFLASDMA
ncbi:hypothetical protein V8C35DRAFT_6422 [Trichoderma chlorosporum]